MLFYVEHYVYKHQYGRGCTCTIRGEREVELMKERHGEEWEDANGNHFFEGPFGSLEEAKAVCHRDEYYLQAQLAM